MTYFVATVSCLFIKQDLQYSNPNVFLLFQPSLTIIAMLNRLKGARSLMLSVGRRQSDASLCNSFADDISLVFVYA